MHFSIQKSLVNKSLIDFQLDFYTKSQISIIEIIRKSKQSKIKKYLFYSKPQIELT
jgi:hypothetical protein